jgi:hypothetical protein
MITVAQSTAAATVRLATLRFYPREAAVRLEIAELLMRMVGNVDQLEWLIDAMINRVGEWRGTAELRAIFCTRFAPADGIPSVDSISLGFTPSDSEAGYVEAQSKRTAMLMAGYRSEQKLIGESINVAAAVKPVAPEPSRHDENRRHSVARERLSNIVGVKDKPTHVAGTPKRTPEQNERILCDLEAQLAAKAKVTT